jgi:hypothetical protein
MWLSRSTSFPGSGNRRRWWFIVIVLAALATVIFVLSRPTQVPAAEPDPPRPTEPTTEHGDEHLERTDGGSSVVGSHRRRQRCFGFTSDHRLSQARLRGSQNDLYLGHPHLNVF